MLVRRSTFDEGVLECEEAEEPSEEVDGGCSEVLMRKKWDVCVDVTVFDPLSPRRLVLPLSNPQPHPHPRVHVPPTRSSQASSLQTPSPPQSPILTPTLNNSQRIQISLPLRLQTAFFCVYSISSFLPCFATVSNWWLVMTSLADQQGG